LNVHAGRINRSGEYGKLKSYELSKCPDKYDVAYCVTLIA